MKNEQDIDVDTEVKLWAFPLFLSAVTTSGMIKNSFSEFETTAYNIPS